jgi:hypothetical protein
VVRKAAFGLSLVDGEQNQRARVALLALVEPESA